MKLSTFKLTATVLFFLILILIGGCKSDSASSSSTQSSDTNIIDDSVIDLPPSLVEDDQSQSSSASGQFFSSAAPQFSQQAEDDTDSQAEIFEGIRSYIRMANQMKDWMKELMKAILEADVVGNVDYDVIHSIDEQDDPEGPVAFKVEEINTQYETKISLYFSEANASTDSPEMIFRYSLQNNRVKGLAKFKLHEAIDSFVPHYTTAIDKFIQVEFDGTQFPKSLEIKFVQDPTGFENGLAAVQGDLTADSYTSDDLESYELGQPEKVMVKALYDGSTYSIYGTSYHPGWATEAALKGETLFFGANRHMYSFKAKSKLGVNYGTKLYLALPDDDATSDDGMWTDDSVGVLFAEALLKSLNDQLDTLVDGDAEDKQNAAMTASWILGDSAFTHHANAIDPLKFTIDNIRDVSSDDIPTNVAYSNFWTGNDFAGIYSWSTSAAAQFIRDATTDEEAVWLYNALYADDIYNWMNTGGKITQNDFENFIASPSQVADKQTLQDQYNSIRYMINPAFYKRYQGFIGTLDETADQFYEFDTVNHTMTATDNQSSIANIKNLDLSDIVPYIPAEVKASVINVE